MSKFQVGDVVRVVNDLEFYFQKGEESLNPVPNYTVVESLRHDWLIDQENHQVAIGWFDTLYAVDFELVSRDKIQPINMEVVNNLSKLDRNYRLAKEVHDSNLEFCKDMLESSEKILQSAESELNALKAKYNIV